MAKKSSWGIWVVFYPFFGLMLLAKHYFVFIVIFSLMGAIGWFAMENYRVYTQGRGEYTIYLPSIFQHDRKGDKTVLNYMIFEPSMLIDDGFTSVAMSAPVLVKKPIEKATKDKSTPVASSVAESKEKVTSQENEKNNSILGRSSNPEKKVSRADRPSRSSIQEESRERFKTRGPLGTVKKKKSRWTLEK